MSQESYDELRVEPTAVQVGDSVSFQCPQVPPCGHREGWASVIKVDREDGGDVVLSIDNRHELIYPSTGLVTVRRKR